MVDKIEALLDGIASTRGWHNPDSLPYQIKNPLLLRNFSPPGRHVVDDQGHRVFSTWLAGYNACLWDLRMKLKGQSRAKIKLEDNLSNLLRVYGVREKLGQQQVVKFLKRALKDDTLTTETPLSYFRS